MTDVSKMTDAELEAAHPTYRHASRYGDITVTLTYDPAAKPTVAACASARADKLTVNGVDYAAAASMTYSVPPLPPGGEEGWAASYTYGGLYIRRLEGLVDPTDTARKVIATEFAEACRLLEATVPNARLTAKLIHTEKKRRGAVGRHKQLHADIARMEAEMVALWDEVKVLQTTLKKANGRG